MQIDITVPSVGESVTEALLAQWYCRDGQQVARDDVLFVVETDKVTLEVTAEAAGRLSIDVLADTTVSVGSVVGRIDTAAEEAASPPEAEPQPARADAGTPSLTEAPETADAPDSADRAEAPEKAQTPPVPAAGQTPAETAAPADAETQEAPVVPPSVRRLAEVHNLDPARIRGTGPAGRLTKTDVLLHLEDRIGGSAAPPPSSTAPAEQPPPEDAGVTRKPLSPIRRRIAERLLQARQQTAMTTTFNEIDMSRVMDLRRRYKEDFKETHGVALGFMSFFIRASVIALTETPEVNAFIEDDQIVYHHYCHIGVAIGSERGLVVPVIRHADRMSFAQIEAAIRAFVSKVADNRLELADLQDGTFTVSNGGVYGNLLSTPILNPPQSGILGMHRIDARPVVRDEAVVIRPMMYVALSYDHRIVDGREAVGFLRRIKECVEHPERMLMEI